MSIPLTCPSCERSFRVKDKCAGTRGRCPHCRALVDVPELPAPADALDTSWLDGVEEEAMPGETPASPLPPRESQAPRSTPMAESEQWIRFRCEHCGTPFRLKPEMRGRSARCPKCTQRMKVPRSSESSSAPTSLPSASTTPPPRPAPLPADEGSLIKLSREVDDLLNELDSLPVDASVVPEAKPLPPAVKKPRQGTNPLRKISLSLNWSDFALVAFLIVGAMAWNQFDLPSAMAVVTLGTFLVVIVTMFSHRDSTLAVVCLVCFCCGIGQIIAGVRGLQKGSEWQVQRTSLVLVISAVLLLLFRAQRLNGEWDEAMTSLDEPARKTERADRARPMGFESIVENMPMPPLPKQMPNVVLSNLECFREEGSLIASIKFDYKIENHPAGYPYNYGWRLDDGNFRSTFRLSGSEFSQTEQTTTVLKSPTILVWMQWTDTPILDERIEKLRISNVVQCTVQTGTAPWKKPPPTVGDDHPEQPERKRDPGEGLEPIDAALARLVGDDFFQQRNALRSLASMPPDADRRDEVARVLVQMLDHRDHALQRAAIEALGAWHTPESIPALIEQARSTNSFQRDDALKMLVKIKEPQAVPLLAELLVDDRFKARQYLVQMGSMVETEVTAYLRHPEPSVREEACRILGTVGTAASVPELLKLERDASRGVYAAADRAIREIRFRYERENPPPANAAPSDPRLRRVPIE